MRSPEPALSEPPKPLEHTPRLDPAPPQPLSNASKIHDNTVRSIGDPILDLEIEALSRSGQWPDDAGPPLSRLTPGWLMRLAFNHQF